MKNVGLVVLTLLAVFALNNCQKDPLPIDNPEDDFIETGNLLINNNPAILAARITYKNEIVPIVDTETSSFLKRVRMIFRK